MSDDTKFPDEMVTEIMLKLDSKSLTRFKSISKPWCSRISSSEFMAKHLLPDNGKDLVLFKRRDKTTHKYVLSFLSDKTLDIDSSRALSLPLHPQLPDHHDITGRYTLGGEPNTEIVSSCCINGLMCLTYSLKDEHIVFWRPLTGDIKILPPSNAPPGSPFCYKDTVYLPDHGFGYDASSGDYKVLKVNQILDYIHSPIRTSLEIYSFKNDSWRGIDNPPIGIACNPICRTYRNEIFIWVVENRSSIMWFRLSDETFGMTGLPQDKDDGGDGDFKMMEILELKDKVALVMYDNEEKVERCYNVWVLLEFGVEDSWTRVFTLGPFVGIERPLWFWKGGKMIVGNSDGDLVLCDPFSQDVKSLNIGGLYRDIWNFQFIAISSDYIS